MQVPTQRVLDILHRSDVALARRAAKELAAVLGFDEKACEEVSLAVSELASNLVKHAGGGTLQLTPLTSEGRIGIRIESIDTGPGIADVEQAVADGFSTASGLGYGLGAVNRLMDTLDITSRQEPSAGTRIVCTRWIREYQPSAEPCPLSFGAATRGHPAMTVNGDAFVIKRWGEHALVALIDGVGHGPPARQAAQTARQYIETHFDRSVEEVFRGVAASCRATRGVVMALARFDWMRARMTFAAVGNVEARVFGAADPVNFVVRRGILGVSVVNATVTHHRWETDWIMVLQSDGMKTHWQWEDFPELATAPASLAAWRLVAALAKDDDDATAVVVKGQAAENAGSL